MHAQPREPLLSIVIPCYNEEATLATCVRKVLELERQHGIDLEVLIVDDASTDASVKVAEALAGRYPQIRVLRHERNQGKGAALRTGFRHVTGRFVAVQDADLEYNPLELADLLQPLLTGVADVVYGSRFLGGRPHRVLYFWHSMGNAFLTFVSNMFTDLNLTDMETCYKVFRREIIQSIEIEENRFGFEPEITAKLAQMGARIYEMGISYHGRTYEEGKKIGWKDGVRALYCIFKYNAPHLPLPMQFLIYLFIGGFSALVNVATFAGLNAAGIGLAPAVLSAFFVAAAVNYLLCITFLFRHKARWTSAMEVLVYLGVVAGGAAFDLAVTRGLAAIGIAAVAAKSLAAAAGLLYNFLARKYVVFPEKTGRSLPARSTPASEPAATPQSPVPVERELEVAHKG